MFLVLSSSNRKENSEGQISSSFGVRGSGDDSTDEYGDVKDEYGDVKYESLDPSVEKLS